ncbi:protoglobin family protein [Sorangium sp. So ce1014]|uniref:protoglobin family protein n=1 Tax=Sorangium sp. So ce1014 TaxID=3133326 RepID=UPI003F5F8F5C
MKHIDEKLLESDLETRFGYLIEFIGFGQADIAAIHGAAPHLAPRVEGLVDAVYEKLFLYDATKRHFVPKQHGYEGQAPVDLLSLTLDHEQVKFRKKHLADYLVRLVTHPYDVKMVAYLDMVGRIHTAKAGNPELVVPLVQINALMGFVADALLQTILSLGLDRQTEVSTLRAFNKLLWIQNDLLARHHVQGA